MLRTADLLALPKRALSAGIDAGLTTDTAAQLLGGWTLTETGLSPVSHARLIWTHSQSYLTGTGLAAALGSGIGEQVHSSGRPRGPGAGASVGSGELCVPPGRSG